MKKIVLLVIAGLFLSTAILTSQEISERKEIAVFNLSYTDWAIPGGALGMVDQAIQNVFVNIGRFDVIGMTYRLNAQDISLFIDQIKQVKEQAIEVPEAVRLGEQTFTEADFNRLVGSFIIVIPVMTYYDAKVQNNKYQVEMETGFTFVNVDEGRAFANFQVRTSGSGDTENEAARSAVDSIPMQLTFEVRKTPEFQLKTGVIDIIGRDLIIEFGRNMGVMVGDEYAIIETRILPSGRQLSDETGLMVIKKVDSEISVAQVLYSSRRPNIGDQLQEIPRLGFDASGYFHYLSSPDLDEETIGVAGIRAVASRGFFSLRPVVGIEIPLGHSFLIWFPVNTYVGLEKNMVFGRLSFSPSVVVGVGQLVPITGDEELTFFSSIGGTALGEVNYLLTRDIKLMFQAGYTYYQALVFGKENPSDYNGVIIGGGITFKL